MFQLIKIVFTFKTVSNYIVRSSDMLVFYNEKSFPEIVTMQSQTYIHLPYLRINIVFIKYYLAELHETARGHNCVPK